LNLETIEELIRKHEGYSEKLYSCSAGKLTIGIGHNIEDLGLHPDVIEHQFVIDVEAAIKDTRRLFPSFDDLPDNKQAVLVDMMFNLGFSRLAKFKKMIKAIENKDWSKAADEMKDSKWAVQVGRRATLLIEMMRG